MKAEIRVSEYLLRMKDASRRLHELFERPEPGLAGWHIAVRREMAEIQELWNGKAATISVKPDDPVT